MRLVHRLEVSETQLSVLTLVCVIGLCLVSTDVITSQNISFLHHNVGVGCVRSWSRPQVLK